jgi:DNA-directed RNA polymerase specialized sigma24 family protein
VKTTRTTTTQDIKQRDAAMAAVLNHSRVRAGTTGVLRKNGWRKSDLADGFAEVQCRAIEWARKPGHVFPTDVEEAAKLCVTIATNWCIDENRKWKARDPYDSGLCEEPDDYAPRETPPPRWDPVDAQRMLAQFRGQLADGQMPPDAEHIVVAVAEGKTMAEIGDELGVTEGCVAHRLEDVRKRFKAHVALLGFLAVLTTLAVG